MRWSDWIRLAARGVMRRKVRALSNAVGVIAGTALLAITLAGGQGIMTALQEELLNNPWLRRIQVSPVYERDQADVPEDAIPDVDVDDEATRERLVERFKDQWLDQQNFEPSAGIPVASLPELRGIDGVEHVLPGLTQAIELQIEDSERLYFQARAIRFSDETRQERLVVSQPDDQSMTLQDQQQGIVISEFAAYQLGFSNPSKWSELLDKQLTLRIARDDNPLTNQLQALAAMGLEDLSLSEVVEVASLVDELPEILKDAGLSGSQIDSILELMGQDTEEQQDVDRTEAAPGDDGDSESSGESNDTEDDSPGKLIEISLPILGVFREPTEEEERRLDWTERFQGVDIWLTAPTAEELAVQLPMLQEYGLFDVRVDAKPGADLKAIQAEIEKAGWQSYSMSDFVDYLIGQVKAGGTVFVVLSIAIFAVCGLNIFNTLSLAVIERTYEIGILKAMGARTSEILGVFLLESMVLGFVASQLGWVIGWGIGLYVESLIASRLAGALQVEELGPIFAWSPWLWASVTALGTLICGVAALLPARHAARVDPIQALRTR